jgi:ketosteroid isomerase-like protein
VRTAVDRLWRALAAGDWAGMLGQFAAGALVFEADSGTAVPAEEYVARHRTAGTAEVAVERAVRESNTIAAEVHVTRGGFERRCAAFYDLRDGRIASATEYWSPAHPAHPSAPVESD